MSYATLAASALRLLTRYGQVGALQSTGVPVYDPSTSSATLGQTNYSPQMAIFDFSTTDPAISQILGSLVQQGDKIVYMAVTDANGAVPKPKTSDNVVDVNGTNYNVQAATTIDPSGAYPVLHIVHARGVPL